jgi:hypothetical protein
MRSLLSKPVPGPDPVNHPSHYTTGRVEVIDIIEDAIGRAPTPVLGNCQGHVLRYVLRMWDKDDPATNAAKALWYLKRLLKHLEPND